MNVKTILRQKNLPLWHECQKHLTMHYWTNLIEYIFHSAQHIWIFLKFVENFIGKKIPHNSPWAEIALFILVSKILCWCAWNSLSFALFLHFVPVFCIWSLWNPYFRSIFHMFVKILYLPLTLSYFLSPLLAIYKLSTLFSKWMNECNQNYQNLVFSPKTYIPIYLYISPPFWHWCQRVLRSKTILSQKITIYL